jgi:scyllo-inositol 2-dehydrogenase (NADP+)
MPTTKPINVAVVGLGRSGYDIHIHRMRGDDRYRITAVADWLPDRVEEVEREFRCATYLNHRALLRDADAEVVVVATYSNTHPSITRDVLRSGRHAICEKPMADSVAAAQSMIAAARKAGRKLFVHHNYRFFPETRHLIDVVRTERIGNVFEIRLRSLDFARRNDWQTLQKFDGGVLNNTCPHFLDIGLQLIEAPVVDVFCDLKLISDVGDVEDHVKVVLRAANGRVYDLEVSTSCKFPEPKWTLLGTQGTLVSDGRTSTLAWFDPKELGKLKPIETPPRGRAYGNDDVIPWQTEEVPSVGPSIGDFYDNVWAVLREREPMGVKPEEALDVVRVTQAAKRASWFYRRGGSPISAPGPRSAPRG